MSIRRRAGISDKTRMAEKRGQGKRQFYKPWIFVREISSEGNCHRPFGIKTQRVHELLSNGELNCFVVFDWAANVVDIREQFPLLPQSETIAIADECGIKHPQFPGSKDLTVMTTDFLLTLSKGSMKTDVARTFKLSSELASKRVIEKLEIERLYWKSRKIDWDIITEKELPEVLWRNIHILRESVMKAPPAEDVDLIEKVAKPMILQEDQPFRKAASKCDNTLGLKPGTALSAIYYLLFSRRWLIDMYLPIDPDGKLILKNKEYEHRTEYDHQVA